MNTLEAQGGKTHFPSQEGAMLGLNQAAASRCFRINTHMLHNTMNGEGLEGSIWLELGLGIFQRPDFRVCPAKPPGIGKHLLCSQMSTWHVKWGCLGMGVPKGAPVHLMGASSSGTFPGGWPQCQGHGIPGQCRARVGLPADWGRGA